MLGAVVLAGLAGAAYFASRPEPTDDEKIEQLKGAPVQQVAVAEKKKAEAVRKPDTVKDRQGEIHYDGANMTGSLGKIIHDGTMAHRSSLAGLHHMPPIHQNA